MTPFWSDRVDIDCTDTEVFDGHLSPPTCSGEEVDKASCSSGTVDFYDDMFKTQVVNPVSNEFETQLVNPLGETQVFDIARETQISSLGGETQELDDPIPDCVKNMNFDTQILNDSDFEEADDCYDDEGTETTEINVHDDLSGDGSAQSYDQMTSLRGHDASKDLEVLPDTLPDKKCNSGPTRLASTHAASLRASGLAARSSAMKTRSPRSSSVMIDKSIEKSSLKGYHVDWQSDGGQFCEIDGDSSNIKCRASIRVASLRASGLAARCSAMQTRNPTHSVMIDKDVGKSSLKDNHVERQADLKFWAGSSAARKLFADDYIPVGDLGDLDTSHDVSYVDPLRLTACNGDQLAGLSYVDSQEPGDLTQDNALDFVEKFLKDNSMEFDQGGGTRKLDAIVQPKSVPNPKGQYNLANIVNCMRTVGESRVFDWDDNREDEGGGDLFCRRKEEFFTETRNLKGKRVDLNGDWEECLSIKNMKSRLFCSDSRLEFSKGNENESARDAFVKCKKNLSNKLDQQNDGEACSGELEDNGVDDQQEVSNVGFDTQMTAEAMEALFHDESIHKLVHNDSPKDSFRGSPFRKPDSSSKSRRSARGHASSSRVAPRQSKKRNQKFSGTLRNVCGTETVKLSERSKKREADGIGRDSINGCNTVQKQLLRGKIVEVSPVAHRTRNSMMLNQSKKAKITSGERERSVTKVGSSIKKSCGDRANRDSKAKRTKSLEAASEILETKSKGSENRAKRSIGERKSSDMLVGPVSLCEDLLGRTMNKRKRSCNMKKTRSSPRLNENLERPTNGRLSIEDSNRPNSVQKLKKKNDGCSVSSIVNTTVDTFPSKRHKPSDTVCSTPPDNCRTPIKAASPVCMGSEYYKQSCKKGLSKPSLLKELRDLTAPGFVSGSFRTESRKRKDMNDVRVLYSQHLDENIIKQQKKTLTRLGVNVVSSMTEATHFIADKFVRTRNMLEAIARGKLVVTHLWIESCGQASCFIDEKNYLLRDAKKEKEFGFSMPGSLACARQRPLLEGRRVLITPSIKPGKDVISRLVKAVKGQAVERIGRSMLKDDQNSDDLLVLSCEEDYNMCMPFLQKGVPVYSSELLLNGIVTQRLEFERHRLFVDHVKRTRSTIWLKKGGNKFHPVTKRR
ncbi:uncharacterized protein LOC111460430 [Cucurbita moschata]|uniref:Uncharacterized protein LOC111460430 n=1 Tax=Cucurbita moschata TaxID=3662 RepID=A0A6J1H849_CUCMO|nr:uncharacterized protein LOC111460430 [Cucurbita moschata]